MANVIQVRQNFPLTSFLEKHFDAKVRARGRSYFDSDRVNLRTIDPDAGIEATVLGSDEYVVWIDVQKAGDTWTMFAECTCPYTDTFDFRCKHLWATLIAVEVDPGNRISRFGPPPGNIKLRAAMIDGEDDDDLDEDYDEGADEVEIAALNAIRDRSGGLLPANFARFVSGRKVKAALSVRQTNTDWRRVWKALDPQPVDTNIANPLKTSPIEPIYILEAESSVYSNRVVLALEHCETTAAGKPGKQKKLIIDPNAIPRFATDGDRRIGLFLLGATSTENDTDYRRYYGSYNSPSERGHAFRIPAALYDELFPLITQTGRFFLRPTRGSEVLTPLRWRGGLPWEMFICVEPGKKNETFAMTPMIRSGEQTVSLSEFEFLFDAERPIGIRGEELVPIESHGCLSWFREFSTIGPIQLPRKDIPHFLKHLAGLRAVPPIEWPSDANVRVLQGIAPRPQVTFRVAKNPGYWDRNSAEVETAFSYDGAMVDADDVGPYVADSEKSRLIARDAAAERGFIGRLAELGARKDPFKGDFVAQRSRLGRMIDALLEEGWTVYGTEGLYRRPGDFKIDVSSGVDWFDLNGTLEFDGNRKAALTDLLAAWRKGERFVKLDDGSLGILPEQWLKKHGLLLGLGESKGESVRFSSTQIGILDAMLAALPEARFDRAVAAARKKLNEFEGIAARREPRQFVGELRPYQREGLGWLHFLADFGWGGCLADDMGLGKTVQVLAFLADRAARRNLGKRKGKKAAVGKTTSGSPSVAGPSLVVAPKSLMFNWERETARFAPKLRSIVYAGPDRKKVKDAFADADVVFTTYDVMRLEIGFFAGKTFDCVILDEAQAIKNPNSGRAKAARLLQAGRRLALSGTPIENHLGDLWSILDFLNPGMLGTVAAFKGFVGNGKVNGGMNGNEVENDVEIGDEHAGDNGNGHPADPRAAQLSILQRAVRPFVLRRTKAQVAPDLPSRDEQTIYCDMTPQQTKYYNNLRDALRLSLLKRVESDGLARSKIHVLEALLRLRQAACHPGLIEKKKEALGSTKLETMLEMIGSIVEEGHKALVYSQFTSMLAFVRKAVDKKGWTFEYLDGKTQDRQGRVDRFQNDPKCPLFLLSLKAGGVGLNLTAAEYVFLLDPWWNPAVEAQAIDRTHRIGQDKSVLAYRLIAHNTVEEKILDLQKSKRQLAESVITDDNSLIRTLTRDDLTVLLS